MEPKFLTEIHVTPLPDGINWRLSHELRYQDSDGQIYEVPAGFVTDFASIPPLARIAGWVLLVSIPAAHFFPWCYTVVAFALWVVMIADEFNSDDQLDAPATLHDYGYRVWRGKKLHWDGVLYRAMKATRRPVWKRLVIYYNVAIFGWLAWKGQEIKEKNLRALKSS